MNPLSVISEEQAIERARNFLMSIPIVSPQLEVLIAIRFDQQKLDEYRQAIQQSLRVSIDSPEIQEHLKASGMDQVHWSVAFYSPPEGEEEEVEVHEQQSCSTGNSTFVIVLDNGDIRFRKRLFPAPAVYSSDDCAWVH